MAGTTTIAWTDRVWNPTRGCTHVTDGCDHCYAETLDRRFHAHLYGEPFVPWTVDAQTAYQRDHPGWSPVTLHGERLDAPLRWKQPARIFVDSMSDLFHPDVLVEFIDIVFATMALTPQHTYQILTKRPALARKWLVDYYAPTIPSAPPPLHGQAAPLPNVHIGVSVTGLEETATFLNELARIPAAVHFVSYEPSLAPFDFTPWLGGECIDWLIVGSESGTKARQFDMACVEGVVAQCREAGVPLFVKQLPHPDGRRGHASEDPNDWPEALRVRQFPTSEVTA